MSKALEYVALTLLVVALAHTGATFIADNLSYSLQRSAAMVANPHDYRG
jgi:hypothetical protein